jgi:hypothetical protein
VRYSLVVRAVFPFFIRTNYERWSGLGIRRSHHIVRVPGSVVLSNPVGGADGVTLMTVFDPSIHNYFDYNTYHFSSPALLKLKSWTWNSNGFRTLPWLGWQALGGTLAARPTEARFFSTLPFLF